MNQLATITQAPVHAPITYTPQQLDLIRRTVASDCNVDEFNLFVEVCRRVGLDPFRKQIYAVVYNKDNADKRKMSIITGVDGYRAVSARTGRYRPDDQPVQIEYDEAAKNADTNPLGIVRATARIFILGADNAWYPVPNEAWWEEYAPIKEIWDGPKGNRQPTGRYELDKKTKWVSMPRVMIAKCAEAGCHRKAFPEDLAGVYVAEEMDQAVYRDMPAADVVEQFEKERRLQITNARDCVCVVWAPSSPMEAVPVGQFFDRAAAWLRECQSADDVRNWRETNAVGLRAFWAHSKSDALELKKRIEKREAELRAAV